MGASCTIGIWRISKKIPLFQKCWSDSEIISQECSLGDPFQKLFAKFWSVHKHGSGEWGLLALYGHEEILKKSSSPKLLVRFWNNFAGMFLGWPFSKVVCEIDLPKNMALMNWGFFALYRDMKKFLKNLLRNCWSDFGIISQECSLGDPFQKLFAKLICQKTWLWWIGASLHYIGTWRNS